MEPKFEPTTQLDADGLNDVLAAAIDGREPTSEMCKVYIGIDWSGIAMLAREFAEKGSIMFAEMVDKAVANGDANELNLNPTFATIGVTAFQLGVLYERERLTRQLASAHAPAAELPEA